MEEGCAGRLWLWTCAEKVNICFAYGEFDEFAADTRQDLSFGCASGILGGYLECYTVRLPLVASD